MQEARIRLLQQMPIFGGIRNDTLGFLLELSPVVRVPKDGFFFREGDEGQSMFVLEEGRVAALVEAHIESPEFGLLGQHHVNVLRLNLALDELR